VSTTPGGIAAQLVINIIMPTMLIKPKRTRRLVVRLVVTFFP
jgi:hypothetical protein